MLQHDDEFPGESTLLLPFTVSTIGWLLFFISYKPRDSCYINDTYNTTELPTLVSRFPIIKKHPRQKTRESYLFSI